MSNGSMVVSSEQRAFTGHFEGKVRSSVSGRHLAYLCAGDELTIGLGHTEQDGVIIRGWLNGLPYEGQAVVQGLEIDDDEAERLLMIDLERHADIVRTAVQVPLTQGMFDALSDLAFNIGGKPFRQGSDLLAALNGGIADTGLMIGPSDYAEAQRQLLRWKRVRNNPNEAVFERRMGNALRWEDLPWHWVRDVDLGTTLAEAKIKAQDVGHPEEWPAPPVFVRDPPPQPAPEPITSEPLPEVTVPEETEIVETRKRIDASAPPKRAEDSKTVRGISEESKGRELKDFAGASQHVTGVAAGVLAFMQHHSFSVVIGTIAMVLVGFWIYGKVREERGKILKAEGRAEATTTKI